MVEKKIPAEWAFVDEPSSAIPSEWAFVDETPAGIAPNPVRDALLNQRAAAGRPLSDLPVEQTQAAGAAAQPAEDLTATPFPLDPLVTSMGASEDRRYWANHPFEGMGETFFRGAEAVAQPLREAHVPEMIGDMVSGGAIPHEYGRAFGNALLDLPGSMGKAIFGDPAMLALSALGPLAPAGALVTRAHALIGSYFGAEGVAGVLPRDFLWSKKWGSWLNGGLNPRTQTEDWSLLKPGEFTKLDPSEQGRIGGAFVNAAIMAGLPMTHASVEWLGAGKDLRIEEKALPVREASVTQHVSDAMTELLNERPFETPEQQAARLVPRDSAGA